MSVKQDLQLSLHLLIIFFLFQDSPVIKKVVPDDEFNDPSTAILVRGKVFNRNCSRPMPDAVVDIWYAGGNPSK